MGAAIHRGATLRHVPANDAGCDPVSATVTAIGYLDAMRGDPGAACPVLLMQGRDGQYLLFPEMPPDLLQGAPTRLNLLRGIGYHPNHPDLPCFCDGTLIRTDQGDIPIENLRPGDLVATRDHGFQRLRWTGRRVHDAAMVADHPDLQPIRIRAGALGKNLPFADLLVSARHRILIRSVIALHMFGAFEVLVAARQLLSIEGIDIANDLNKVSYRYLLFDQHEVTVSNGAETESLSVGDVAMKSVGLVAHRENLANLPTRATAGHPRPSRPIPTARMAQLLADRHHKHQRPLFS